MCSDSDRHRIYIDMFSMWVTSVLLLVLLQELKDVLFYFKFQGPVMVNVASMWYR